MAPLPTIADTVRVAFHWSSPSYTRDAINVMHFFSASYDTSSLITALEANVTAAMWQHAATDTFCHQLTLTPLDGSSASVIHGTTVAAKWKGAQIGSASVPQAAVIASHRTGVRGRSHRGRTFLPWPVEGVVNYGKYDSANAAIQQPAWATFLTNMGTATHSLSVASYKHATAAFVLTTTIELDLGTQRLRQPRP